MVFRNLRCHKRIDCSDAEVEHIPEKWGSKAMQHVTALKFQVPRNCKHDVHDWMNNTFILRPITVISCMQQVTALVSKQTTHSYFNPVIF